MKKAHFLTGGTGFVGSCLILELLQQTDAEIVCLVRSGKKGVYTRLYGLLSEAAYAYGYDEAIIQAIGKRCHIVEGDIWSELCGVSLDQSFQIEQFWHCAASLNYEESQAETIFATNIGGTKNALALARHYGASTFNYISTAYVAGTRTGLLCEALIDETDGMENCNTYEKSKIQAEKVVAQTPGMRVRIFRPSVVIGHSETHAIVGSFTGVYGLARTIQWQVQRKAGSLQEGLIRMYADADVHLNCIPVDLVAKQAVQCAQSSSTELVFHLTNATPPKLGDILGTICQEIGLPDPLLVTAIEDLHPFPFDVQLNRRLEFYTSYFFGDKVFDRHNIDAALGQPGAGNFNLDRTRLQAFFRWYLNLLSSKRLVS